MTFSCTCNSCGKLFTLNFDELDATPAFCPFCGEVIEDDEEATYDDDIDFNEAAFEDKFESFDS